MAAEGRSTKREQTDRVELWGRRIGRALSIAAALGLVIWFALGYLR